MSPSLPPTRHHPTTVPADSAPLAIPACPASWPREPKAYLQLHATATASLQTLPPHKSKCKPALSWGHGGATGHLEETQSQGLCRVDVDSLCLVAKGPRSVSRLTSFRSAGVDQGTSPIWGTRLLHWGLPSSSPPVCAPHWASWPPRSTRLSDQTISNRLWVQALQVFILLTTTAFNKKEVSGSFPSAMCPLWSGDSQAPGIPACLGLKGLNLEQGFGTQA